MTHTYGVLATDFTVGQRVEIHPACDLWMAGRRFGEVAKIGDYFVHVALDGYKTVAFWPGNVRALDTGTHPAATQCDCNAHEHPSSIEGYFVHSESCPKFWD